MKVWVIFLCPGHRHSRSVLFQIDYGIEDEERPKFRTMESYGEHLKRIDADNKFMNDAGLAVAPSPATRAICCVTA